MLSKRHHRSQRVAVAIVLAGAVTAACGDSAATGGDAGSGDDATWQFRVNDYNPPTHAFVTHGWEPFAEEVTEATDGRVTFDIFPSEGLGKVSDTLSALDSGAVDMASTISGFHPEAMQIMQSTVAVGFENAALGTQAMWELCQMDPFKAEFEKNDVVPIFCLATPPYDLLLGDDEINGIPDAFDGLRLRATGLQIEILELMGASPTSMSSTEIYTAVQQGTIDGTTMGWYTLPAFSFDEIIDHATRGLESWQAGIMFFGMSTSTWEELPEDVQTVMIDAGKRYSLEIANELDRQGEEAYEANKNAMRIHTVTEEERAQVAEVIDKALADWVVAMESAGLGAEANAATEALRAVRDIEEKPVDEWAEFGY